VSQHGNRQKHESRNPLQRALIDRFHGAVVDALREADAKTVLDLGCGEGYVLAALHAAQLNGDFTGIDLSAEALEHARARLPETVHLERADARSLVDEGRSFDAVLMLEVLEHIPDPSVMLPILERLTRRWLILSVPNEPFFRGLNFMRGKHLTRWGNDPEHVNHWGRRSFRRFIEARFDVIAMPRVFPWTMIVARKRGDGLG
jgi:2-polyprenyl-3-methyl-5-hydroxy-6-metoxy-1,4-benzoquinol methylase